MIFLQVICWISLFLIFYTYLIFPLLLQWMASKIEKQPEVFARDELPFVSVLISAFNEEDVIEAKIASLLKSDYPVDRMEILVGSDASTDSTNQILSRLKEAHSLLHFREFKERTGKPGVINQLVLSASGEILVITDANVMVDTNTLSEIASRFKPERVGLVDTRMINTMLKKDGISHQEKFYISREVKIKQHESMLWGSMMGPFGGCYAVRKSLYTPVPDNFLVDDFYINMSVIKQEYQCISNLQARVYEDVSNNLKEEFRRKKRISAGNFQNLSKFGGLLFSRLPGVAFCFFSHKVVRWMVPFLVLITLSISIYFSPDSTIYLLLSILQLVVIAIPLIDYFLRKIKIHSIPLRFISHFVLMNLALLAGFLNYLGGIRNNVWQPTKRNQD